MKTMKKHRAWRAMTAFALILGMMSMLGSSLPTVSAAESGSTVDPYPLSPVIRVEGNTANPMTSAMDSINLWRTGGTSTGRRVAVKVALMENDLSDITQYYVRMSYPRRQKDYTRDVEFTLVDQKDVMYGWKYDPSKDSSKKGYRAEVLGEGKPEDINESNIVENERSWWADKVQAGKEYWYIHDASNWEQRTVNTAGSVTTAGKSFEKNNVKYAVFQLDEPSTISFVNIGQIWGKKSNGEFVQLFDPESSTIVTGSSDQANSVSISVWNGTSSVAAGDYQLTKMRAGEVLVKESADELSAMRMDIPTDISKYNGISFNVDLTGCTQALYIDKFIKNDNDTWYSNDGLAMLYPENGTPYSSHTNVLPKGFKGRVEIAFCAFILKGVGDTTNKLDLSNTTGTLGFTIRPLYDTSNRFVGNFTIKNVKLVADAKVEYYVLQYLRRPDGRCNEAVMNKQTATAGADAYEPDNTKEIDYRGEKLTCVLEDEPVLEGNAAYYNGSTFSPYKIKDDGVVSWGYRPRVYYHKQGGYTINKVFGLDQLPDKILDAEYDKDALEEKLPTGGITVGNDGNGLLQLTGNWSITKNENDVTVKFTPNPQLPDWLNDNKNVLTRTITLVKPTGIEIATKPNKLNYTVGDEFKTDGLTVKLYYSNGEKEVLDANAYTVSTPDMSSAGTKTVTVTYSTTYGTWSKDFKINVSAAKVPEKIEVDTQNVKTEYTVGDEFKTDGLTVKLYYSNGEKEVLDANAYTVSTPDMTIPGTKTVTVTYGEMTDTFEITVRENSSTNEDKIVVTSNPDKVSYTVGETFDKTGLVVELHKSNGDEVTLTDEQYELSGLDMTTPGTKTITVSYKLADDKTLSTTFEITVTASPTTNEDKIVVTSKPTKVEYTVGEFFDKAGLSVELQKIDGTKETLADDKYTVSIPDMTTAGTKTITVTYKLADGKTLTATFDITVKAKAPTPPAQVEEESKAPEKIEITSKPKKVTYTVGAFFDKTGLSVNLCYSNGEQEALSENEYTVSVPDMTKAGTKRITVTYGTLSTSFDITVKAAKVPLEIEVIAKPAKVEYTVGDTFDKTGLSVELYYSNGEKEILDAKDYTVSTPDMTKAGTEKITVTYGTLSTSFEITVKAKVPEKIEVTAKPAKVEYTVGDSFMTEGLEVTLCFNNGEVEALAEKDYTVSTPDMSTAGVKTVKVTYEKMTASFEITVSEAENSGIGTGAVIGIAAVLIILCAALIVLWFWWKRRVKE